MKHFIIVVIHVINLIIFVPLSWINMLLKKRKWVRGDNKFHVIQKLRKAIMKRSRLKKGYNN